MENEIKVGEYTRNEDGYIEKIDSFDKLTNIYKDEEGILRKWEGEDVWGNEYSSIIVKHSSNLIDLIQCGDYVNGEKVTDIKEWNSSKDGYFRYAVTCHYEIIRADEIKTIVTKEMMESISYKVERKD